MANHTRNTLKVVENWNSDSTSTYKNSKTLHKTNQTKDSMSCAMDVRINRRYLYQINTAIIWLEKANLVKKFVIYIKWLRVKVKTSVEFGNRESHLK